MQRALGLDVGTRRIGAALSDPLGISAQRLTVIERHDPARDFHAIASLVSTHEVGVVVVGLPLTLKGTRSEQTKSVEEFVNGLRQRRACPVEVVDERLTTVEGHRALRSTGASPRTHKRLIDQVAAQLILQTYLDAHARTT
ncbi:MAG: hypothetical protein A3G88_04980 [Omnitrophica WOR_2 bacterium RIFCSPLOWO2_12_FULL_63_16]|nr:MAG: hypothetical protein A3G88_04980 [Omnitrophica WOR_2 bacterium RIFCSPLOWO2_12_FULL_63_16]